MLSMPMSARRSASSCDRAILDDVIDRFGTEVQIREHDENTFTAGFTAPPRGVKFWALQYLPRVEVVEPAWLREEIIESLMQNRYLLGDDQFTGLPVHR